MPAAEQVNVEVIHGLATMFSRVDHGAITTGEILGARNLSRHPEQMTEQGRMARTGISQRNDMLARHDQDMHRSLRIDVGKGVALVVLKDSGRGDLAFDDLAEKAVGHATSLQGALAGPAV